MATRSVIYTIAAPSALLLMLSGCGGGDGGIASTPIAPVTPPPSPPPPPPPPSVATFPPAGNQSTYYTTTHASINALVDLATAPDGTGDITAVRKVTSAGGPTYGNFHYTAPDTYDVEFGGWGGPGFGPSDKIGSTAEFDRFRLRTPNGYSGDLALARNGAAITLNYSTFGNVAYNIISNTEQEITYFTAGSLTPPSQIPKSGTASYLGVADGLWLDGSAARRLYGSIARMTADFSAGTITTSLDLKGRDNAFGDFMASPVVALGLFESTTRIGEYGFSGSYSPVGGYSGSYYGALFGSQAQEAGWGFSLTGPNGQNVTGAAAVKQ